MTHSIQLFVTWFRCVAWQRVRFENYQHLITRLFCLRVIEALTRQPVWGYGCPGPPPNFKKKCYYKTKIGSWLCTYLKFNTKLQKFNQLNFLVLKGSNAFLEPAWIRWHFFLLLNWVLPGFFLNPYITLNSSCTYVRKINMKNWEKNVLFAFFYLNLFHKRSLFTFLRFTVYRTQEFMYVTVFFHVLVEKYLQGLITYSITHQLI